MTKENLRDLFCKQLNSSQHWGDLSIFDEFFESNVVIPRGDNRHPYADVLHEWVEGAEVEYSLVQYLEEDKWVVLNNCKTYMNDDRYRIKPSEPVWEYQWDTKLPDNTWQYYKLGEQTHFTDGEIGSDANWLCKVEHKKRERK